ncbi:MAG: 30S ribosomal protein S6 [Candidatus Moranbacteria bacterium]|nr:30S ribosomal protein S6 [Candidatus Moranbacteria bacterium]
MIYEINFLVLQSKTTELEKIKKETKKFIESFNAKIVEEKEYLKRKLSYEIQHENYGFFTVLRFEFKGAKNLDELKNKLNQKSEIARYIIVRADKLPSLEEQDVKELEKIHSDNKSIKSEDLEKALTEQKKTEVAKKKDEVKKEEVKAIEKKTTVTKEKAKTTKKKPAKAQEVEEEKGEIDKERPKKKPIAKKKMKPSKKALPAKEVEETITKKAKSKKKAEVKKEARPTEEKEPEEEGKVSLDELDKKLDEILNS